MKVNLVRKLWKERVQIPILQKQVDKTLREIDVKLNNKRSKKQMKEYIDKVLKNKSLTVFLAIVAVVLLFSWIEG
jgi:cytochrome c-type biogenesis protein CcmH/NrfG